jgi:hypothetical protein
MTELRKFFEEFSNVEGGLSPEEAQVDWYSPDREYYSYFLRGLTLSSFTGKILPKITSGSEVGEGLDGVPVERDRNETERDSSETERDSSDEDELLVRDQKRKEKATEKPPTDPKGKEKATEEPQRDPKGKEKATEKPPTDPKGKGKATEEPQRDPKGKEKATEELQRGIVTRSKSKGDGHNDELEEDGNVKSNDKGGGDQGGGSRGGPGRVEGAGSKGSKTPNKKKTSGSKPEKTGKVAQTKPAGDRPMRVIIDLTYPVCAANFFMCLIHSPEHILPTQEPKLESVTSFPATRVSRGNQIHLDMLRRQRTVHRCLRLPWICGCLMDMRIMTPWIIDSWLQKQR